MQKPNPAIDIKYMLSGSSNNRFNISEKVVSSHFVHENIANIKETNPIAYTLM